MKKLKGILIYSLIMALILYSSCKEEEIDEFICGEDEKIGFLPCFDSILPFYSHTLSLNPLFTGKDTIHIPGYQYFSGTSFINIRGDEGLADLMNIHSCCDLLSYIDIADNEPYLEWDDPINFKLKAVAIFDEQIELTKDGLRILNTDDIVWTWNSGLDSGSNYQNKMKIKYSYGKMVHSGIISEGPVVPLVQGKIYSWFVWAWNDYGTEIIASSRELPFIVDEIRTVPIESVRQIEGRWTVDQLYDASGNPLDDNDFPINEIYFNRYCNVDHRKWEDEYCINNSTDTAKLVLSLDTLHLSGITEIKEFYNPRMRCDEIFKAKCHFNGNIVTVEFLRDISIYLPAP